ncbi:MAG: chromophore lyase CpcT/CpeT [Planctomycetota bacterium]
MLAGTYTSAAQAAEDREFFEVELHMARIWNDRADGHWLYVEQAMATAREKPYRQRIYCVVDGDEGSVLSMVYELPNAAERVGAWREPQMFAADTPDALVKREGCVIRLVRDGDAWTGSTNGKECLSTLRGSTYATSEVRLLADRIETWDRGFDATDQQVWGSKKGAYRFIKEPSKGR